MCRKMPRCQIAGKSTDNLAKDPARRGEEGEGDPRILQGEIDPWLERESHEGEYRAWVLEGYFTLRENLRKGNRGEYPS